MLGHKYEAAAAGLAIIDAKESPLRSATGQMGPPHCFSSVGARTKDKENRWRPKGRVGVGRK